MASFEMAAVWYPMNRVGGKIFSSALARDVLVDNRLSMKEESSGTGDIDFRLPNNDPIHARVTDAFLLEPPTHGQWGTRAGWGKKKKLGGEAKSAECAGIPICERPANIFGSF